MRSVTGYAGLFSSAEQWVVLTFARMPGTRANGRHWVFTNELSLLQKGRCICHRQPRVFDQWMQRLTHGVTIPVTTTRATCIATCERPHALENELGRRSTRRLDALRAMPHERAAMNLDNR